MSSDTDPITMISETGPIVCEQSGSCAIGDTTRGIGSLGFEAKAASTSTS